MKGVPSKDGKKSCLLEEDEEC